MMTTQTANFVSEARVAAATPQRYLGQLCKHFQHKIPANWSDDYSRGDMKFGAGTCELAADDAAQQLTLRAMADSAEELERVENVVARHLERFAFRETLAITWTRQGSAS